MLNEYYPHHIEPICLCVDRKNYLTYDGVSYFEKERYSIIEYKKPGEDNKPNNNLLSWIGGDINGAL